MERKMDVSRVALPERAERVEDQGDTLQIDPLLSDADVSFAMASRAGYSALRKQRADQLKGVIER